MSTTVVFHKNDLPIQSDSHPNGGRATTEAPSILAHSRIAGRKKEDKNHAYNKSDLASF